MTRDEEEQARKICKRHNVKFYKIRKTYIIYIWIRMNYDKALGKLSIISAKQFFLYYSVSSESYNLIRLSKIIVS